MRSNILQAHETFVSLAALLSPPDAASQPVAEPVLDAAPQPAAQCTHAEIEEALRDARLFRARLHEALDLAVETLVGDIAADVLGRELELAPVDIATIVRRALSRYLGDDPVRVRLHPEDAASMASGDIVVVTDGGLRRGDAVVELRCGEVDASLGVRLDEVMRRMAR